MLTPNKISLRAVLSIGGVIAAFVGVAAPASALPPTCAVGTANQDAVNYSLAADCSASVLDGSSAIGVVTIPSSITNAGDSYSVTSIYDSAFDSDSLLSSVVFPESLVSIEDAAFRGTGLSGVLDLSSLTSLSSIGNLAFTSNPMLSGAVFPASITTIGAGAFDGSGLVDATFYGALPSTGSTDSFPPATVLHYCGAPTTWFGFEAVSGNCFVTFNSTGGTSVPAEVIAYGATLAAPSSPTRSGYVFAGWVTSQGGDVSFPFGTGATSHASAYASWVEAPVIPVELSSTGIDSSTIGGLTLLLLTLGISTMALKNRSKRRTM